MTSMQSLEDLFVDELRDLYNAERQLLKALPAMRKHATSQQLADAFETHLKQTEGHVERLEKIFGQLDQSPRGKKCKGMEGIVAEGKEALDLKGDEDTLDAAIIGAAQRVEHYEIAAYGTACAHARATGHSDAIRLLEATLEEEKEADRLLTEIAESSINAQATTPDGEMGEATSMNTSGGDRHRTSAHTSRARPPRARNGRRQRTRGAV